MSTAEVLRDIAWFYSITNPNRDELGENVAGMVGRHADLLGSTIDAIIAGADAEAIHEYIKSALVAVSDAEMRREFPGQAA